MSHLEMIVAVVAILGGIFIGALAIVLDFLRKGSKGHLNADDARIIQEIHQGLQRMEKRIEAVETIVIDRAAKEDEALERE